MTTIAEQLTLQFYSWELKGRGWQVFDEPVELEPPFQPFFTHRLPASQHRIDDGRRPTLLSSIATSVRNIFCPVKESDIEQAGEEIAAYAFVSDSALCTISVIFPKGYKVPIHETEQLILVLRNCQYPVSFEIVATDKKISIQYTCLLDDSAFLKGQLKAHFPQATVIEKEDALLALFPNAVSVIDFGLQDEFMRPLAMAGTFDPDPLTSLFGFFEHVAEGEGGALQIIFRGSVNAWSESIARSVTTEDGAPFFIDAPDMLPLAKQKIATPIFGVIIRAIGSGINDNSAVTNAQSIGMAVRHLSQSAGNSLVTLSNEHYEDDTHCEDVLLRQSHRLGMLLNSRELATLVHFPSASVVSSKLERAAKKTKAAPQIALGHSLLLGSNIHQGKQVSVSLSNEQRLRHTHIIGATGTGKSTLLVSLICQDIQNGEGVTVLDPHGDLVEEILQWIPPSRLQDVVLIDPADSEFPVGFNILKAHSDIEKEVLSSDLVAAFRRLSTSWGDQMNSVFANAILAILESGKGGTLVDLRRFLIEKSFREEFLKSISDPSIVYYWQKEYPLLKSGSIGPILTRLDTFLRPRLIRNMVAQQQGIDFEHILNTKKILLVKLSQGLIGTENSYLLGSFVVSKIHQAALARQQTQVRNNYFLYIDEFQHFITPSMASILSGARKYHLGLILAHQDLQQIQKQDSELLHTIIANAGTRICFRLGDIDAKKMAEGLSFFEAADLQNLNTGEAVARIERPEFDFSLSTTPFQKSGNPYLSKDAVIAQSRNTYSKPKHEVEALLTENMRVVVDAIDEVKTPVVEKQEPVKPEAPKKDFQEAAAVKIPMTIDEKVKDSIVNKKEETQHRYLQNLVKRMAEDYGYKTTIEEVTPDGKGKVDVGLLRNGRRIACEISVTTTAPWEIHNVEKCLAAGYDTVIVCSTDKKNLEKIRKFIQQKIDTTLQANILTLDPEALFLYLGQQIAEEGNTEERINGFRVKVSYNAVPQTAAKQKKEHIVKTIIDSMRKKDKKE